MKFTAVLMVTAAALVINQPAPPVAFVDVTVVPLDRPGAVAHQTVLVRGSRIAAIGDRSDVRVPAGARTIDGRGKFLMPGMADMHAHVPFGETATVADMHRTLLLFAANGITTIRNMEGERRHLDLRAAVAAATVIGPTIYTTGPSLNGRSAPTPDSAVRLVQDNKGRGYDFLKVNPGISMAAARAAIVEARRSGVDLAGHVPGGLGLIGALDAGFTSLEHLDGFVGHAITKDAGPARQSPGFFGVNLVDALDGVQVVDAVDRIRRAGTAIVPTQVLLETFLGPSSADALSRRAGIEFLPPRLLDEWMQDRAAFTSQREFNVERNGRFLEWRRQLLRALFDTGVPIMLGSDAGQTFVIPGVSLVDEMEAFARSGLTPYAIYAAGARTPARFLGRDGDAGIVAVGMIADLVLLDADPLRTVSNYRRQAGTMLRGRWFTRSDLLARLHAMREPPPVPASS